jgi:S1/P1 Nuclease
LPEVDEFLGRVGDQVDILQRIAVEQQQIGKRALTWQLNPSACEVFHTNAVDIDVPSRTRHGTGEGIMIRSVSGFSAIALATALNFVQPQTALAWGDEGHEVVALVAQSFLEPDVRKRVSALLAADTDSLTSHDIASEATWADKFRDANVDGSRNKTRQWHFVDVEISSPNLDAACFNHPPIPAGALASDGPADDCVVDKIQEFAAELANPATDLEEQVEALKFVLHFVGDLHQPLHSSDDQDRGGNDKKVSAAGFPAGNLHHFWDTEFVEQLGPDAKTIASDLIGHITAQQQTQWQAGGPTDWANETFKIALDDAYGQLPPPSAHGSFRLSDDYVSTATSDVSLQLSKAGVRLAAILNQVLRTPPVAVSARGAPATGASNR